MEDVVTDRAADVLAAGAVLTRRDAAAEPAFLDWTSIVSGPCDCCNLAAMRDRKEKVL